MAPLEVPADDAIWLTEPRDAVVVTGGDAQSYLQSQISQDVSDLAVGASRWTLVLTPNGKIGVLARIWRRSDDSFVLDTETGFGELLEARLTRFMIRVDVAADSEELVATIPPSSDAMAGYDPHGMVVGWWGRGAVLLGANPQVPPSAVAGDAGDLQDARVRAGWPAMGSEIEPDERIPAEVGIASVAVSFTKGCYPGQELVERMDSRGAQAPRRLAQLDVGPDARPGDPVVVDGADVGTLTSVAGGLALGFIKRGADIGRPVADMVGPTE